MKLSNDFHCDWYYRVQSRFLCVKVMQTISEVKRNSLTLATLNLQHKRIPRHTEGLLTGDMFPINYFSVSEVSQQFTDFQDWFTDELPDSYWRFNKIHSYGAAIDEPPLLGPAFSGYTEAQ